MPHYTFRRIDYYDITAINATEALRQLNKYQGIYPDEFRNDDKFDDDWHDVEYVGND